ncbi:uncharacterized protein LOC143875744 [Tasmannia lanceolata]|uniref:uncharacterized protein LOC143875744 n=1 Tax=Tasmannia lanceolata TaxID=3420 RepID=UPI004063B542
MISSSLDIFSSSKTDEIMSRYRPIAPKPQFLIQNPVLENSPPSENQHQSPFSKPVRSRKRNKACNSSTTHKKTKSNLSTDGAGIAHNTQLSLPLQNFGHGFPGFSLPNPGFFDNPPRKNCGDLVTLPLLPFACQVPPINYPDMESMGLFTHMEGNLLDLNCRPEIPEEKDLLQKLHVPFSGLNDSACGKLVMPQPLRPVGSSISVGCISEGNKSSSKAPVSKKPEEVEEEVESEALPSVISDSKNQVRLANSAYKEMVGQPECLWLDSMVTKDGELMAASKRISGEVMLDLSDSTVPISSNGFSCRVKIEWASNGQKIFIIAPCDVIRLSCESKDYLYSWRFHTSVACDAKL